jgi:hypothetical protein
MHRLEVKMAQIAAIARRDIKAASILETWPGAVTESQLNGYCHREIVAEGTDSSLALDVNLKSPTQSETFLGPGGEARNCWQESSNFPAIGKSRITSNIRSYGTLR